MQDFNALRDKSLKVLTVIFQDSKGGDKHMFGVTIAVELLTNPNITHVPGTKMC